MGRIDVSGLVRSAGRFKMKLLDELISSSTQHGKSELSRIEYLDGWRGLAITFVLIYHFFDITFISFGRLGVDIFFVLSGLLMSNILFVKRTPLKTFYKRRLSRIIPVLFIYITFFCAISFIFSLSNEHENYIYLITFLRSYITIPTSIWHTGMPLGHLWSLNVEEHCYILLSLVTLIPFIKNKEFVALFLLGSLAILLQYYYIHNPAHAPESWGLRTEIVASHILISASYFLIKNKFESYVKSWMPLSALILTLLCYSDYSPHWTAKWALSPFLLAFTVNHLNKMPNVIMSILLFKPLQILGLWSYSIYLWQQPFYYYLTKFGNIFLLSNILGLLLAIITGYLSFKYIEQPIRRYLNDRY